MTVSVASLGYTCSTAVVRYRYHSPAYRTKVGVTACSSAATTDPFYCRFNL